MTNRPEHVEAVARLLGVHDIHDIHEAPEGMDHWGEDPEWLVADWQWEVVEGNTRLGYWYWVAVQRALTDEGFND